MGKTNAQLQKDNRELRAIIKTREQEILALTNKDGVVNLEVGSIISLPGTDWCFILGTIDHSKLDNPKLEFARIDMKKE